MNDAYAAGLIDGEGTLGVVRTGRRGHTPRIVVAMTNEVVIYWLKETYGGTIHIRDYPPRKRQWAWTVSGGPRVASVLRRIQPYLIVKSIEGWLLSEFIASRTVSKNRRVPITDEEWALREGYRLALQEAKR